MAITYSLAPIPKWVLLNNDGTAAGGALLYTYSSLNHTVNKPVYQDAGGVNAYTNPIEFDLNGTQGPFYWEFDTGNPDELYFLRATDADGNELWTIEDYTPPDGGGGGSIITNYVSLNNMIANSGLIDNIGSVAVNLSSVTNLVLAPSNHVGFTPADVNPLYVSGGNGVVGPDIRFLKDSTGATDSMVFTEFSLSNGPFTDDSTPQFYGQYTCTVADTVETYKDIQFPICQGVKNLANTVVTFQIWLKTLGGTVDVGVSSRQYYGSGATVTKELVQDQSGLVTLDTNWQQVSVSFTMPSTAGVALGATPTGDDAVYVLLDLPLNQVCTVLWAKPKFFAVDVESTTDTFETYDQTDAVTQSPRTGDVKAALRVNAQKGWLSMNDGTIGNVGSGAGTALESTFQLFTTLYTNVSDTYAPVSGGRSAPGTTMVNAIADFIAGKTLTLPQSAGRALGGAGAGSGLTSRALGLATGSETHTLVASELPDPLTAHAKSVMVRSDVANVDVIQNSDTDNGGTVGNIGGNNAFSIMQPTSFMNLFIKL